MLALNIAWSSLSRTPVDVAGTYLPRLGRWGRPPGDTRTPERREFVATSVAVSLRADTVATGHDRLGR
jgi:hypothetical protein